MRNIADLLEMANGFGGNISIETGGNYFSTNGNNNSAILRSGNLTVTDSLIRIGAIDMNRNTAPSDIESYSSDVQDTYWLFCHDSAKKCPAFFRYADGILAESNIYLHKIESLTEEDKFDIRKKAKKNAELITTLKVKYDINYFKLREKTTTKVNLYSLRVSSKKKLHPPKISSSIFSLLKENNLDDLKDSFVLIYNGKRSYILGLNAYDKPVLFKVPSKHTAAKPIKKICQSEEKNIVTQVYSINNRDSFICEVTKLVNNPYFLRENLSNLSEHTMKLANNMDKMGIDNSLSTILTFPPELFKKVSDYESGANYAAKLLNSLTNIGYKNPLESMLNIPQEKLLHLLCYESRVNYCNKIVNALFGFGYKDPLSTFTSLDTSNFKYILTYESRVNYAIRTMNNLQRHEYKDPWSALFATSKDRLKYLFTYESRINHAIDLMNSLSSIGCKCPWESINEIPNSTIKNMFQYDSNYIKATAAAFSGLKYPSANAKKVLGGIPPEQWAHIFVDNSYLQAIINLSDQLAMRDIEMPVWMLGLKSKYLELMSENSVNVCKLLAGMASKGMNGFQTLVELGPFGFKIAMSNPKKLLQKIEAGSDIVKLIKNSWEYEEEPIENMFSSFESFNRYEATKAPVQDKFRIVTNYSISYISPSDDPSIAIKDGIKPKFES